MKSRFRIVMAYVLAISLLLSQHLPAFATGENQPESQTTGEVTPSPSADPTPTLMVTPSATEAVYTETPTVTESVYTPATTSTPIITVTPTITPTVNPSPTATIGPRNYISENYEEKFETDVTYLTTWQKSNLKAFEGIYSLKSSGVSNFTFNVSVTSSSYISFKYLVSSEANYDWFRVYVDNKLVLSESGIKEWWQSKTYNLSEDNHIIRMEYTKDGSGDRGYDSVFVDDIKVFNLSSYRALHPPDLEISNSNIETFENNSLCFNYSGNWVRTDGQCYEGNWSMRSNSATGHNGVSEFVIDTYCVDQSFIKFKYMVSSESGFDWFRFYVDGDVKVEDSGIKNWKTFTYNLSPGKHTVKFVYSKDGSAVNGLDAAFVDKIEINGSILKVTKSIETINTDIDVDNANIWANSYMACNVVTYNHEIGMRAYDMASNVSDPSSISVTNSVYIPALDPPIVNTQSTNFESFETESTIFKTISNNWIRNDTQFTDGSYSLRSNPATGHRGKSEFFFDLYCADETLISFKYMVSSESGYDWFRFYLDDTVKVQESGINNWKSFTYSIPMGRHTIRFVYSKDGSAINGLDAAFIDEIELNGTLFSINPAIEAVKTQIKIGENTDWYDGAYNGLIKTDDKIYLKSQDIAGNWSSETSMWINPGTPPLPPTALMLISKSYTTVSLSWSASTSDITGYYVYRDGEQIAQVSGTTYIDNAELIPGTTYNYEVKAFNTRGVVSEPSNSVQVTTDIDSEAPTTPSNFRMMSKTISSISLSWNSSIDNVRIKEYGIFRDGIEIATTSTTTYTDTNLLPGKYVYQVKAYDLSGNESVASNSIMFDNEAPSIPQNLRITETSATMVTIAWDASVDNLEVKGYEIYRDGTKIGQTDKTTYSDSALESEKSYVYSVKAYDTSGNLTPLSSHIMATTIIDTIPPSKPTGLSVSAKTGTSVTLSWSVTPDNVATVGYEMYRDGSKLATVTEATYTDRGLTPDTVYSYTIKAFDAAGNISEVSDALGVTPVMPKITSFSPATSVTIGGDGNKRLYVYFANSNNAAGASADFEYSADGVNWTSITGTKYGPYNHSSSTLYFYCDWNLAPLSTGIYNVRYSVYDAENNVDRQTTTYMVDRRAPSIPNNLLAAAGPGMVNLVWEPSPEADTSLYRIYRATSDTGEYSKIAQTNGKTSVTYTDTSTVAGQTYFYKVSAVDKYGQESALSESVSVIAIADTVLPSIIGIEPVDGTKIGASASILVRAEDNLLLSSIKLQYSLNGTDNWIDINTINTTSNATFTWNLPSINGNIYVRAIAIDSSGNESDGSPARTYVVDQQGPVQVTGLMATAATTTVTLRWNDVPDDDFYYFQVERKDSENGTFQNIGKTETTLGMNVTGLNPSTTYWFRVAAYDRLGNRGQASTEVQVVTTADTQPPVITVLEPKPGRFSTSITVKGIATDDVGVTSFTFQTSRDKMTWSEVITFTPDPAKTTVTYSHTIDLSLEEEGPLYVRAVAQDAAGNVSDTSEVAPYVEHRIDHTPPNVPAGFTLTPTTGYISLSWSQGTDIDLAYYRLYRADSEFGAYSVIADNHKYLSFNDRNTSHANTYYYKVTAVDSAGNESIAAGPLSGQLLPDTESPEVVSIYPTEGSMLPANPVISVLASDNYKLSKVTIEYQTGGGIEDQWTLIGTKNLNVYSDVSSFKWDTSTLINGSYVLRSLAYDQAGNISVAKSVYYDINVDPPSIPVVSAVPGGWKVDLSWTSGNESDLAGFRVYRSTVSGGSYKLIKETTYTTFTDDKLAPGQNYYYKVEAIDKYKNASTSAEIVTSPLDEDPYAPTAEAGIDLLATVGMEVAFDGTLSKDNDRIASYSWDFGDGSTSYIAQPNYIYAAAGTYTVTLTVADPAGNTHEDTTTVIVYPEEQVGTLEVKVIDNSTGAIIEGASVYVDFPSDVPRLFTVNKSGIATVVATAGNYNVSAYKTGYLPSEVNVKVEQYQKTQVTIKLEKGELVVGDIYVRRMELQEIVDAGIDIYAEENQFVYKFEVHLEFNEEPLPVHYMVTNGLGAIFTGEGGFSIEEGTTRSPTKGPGTTTGQAIPQVIPHPEHPEVPPTVAYLVIPKYASWLKEFFEVGLVLQNMADPQFVIQDSIATLKLPEGISLAPTAKEQNLTIELGDLAGQEIKTAKWIIRGDVKGEYHLEADFKGTLMPFAAPVNANFKTKEPFRVWGGDALHIYVLTEDSYYVGENYYTHFMLVNESNIPIYNIKTDFGTYVQPTAKTEIIYPGGTKTTIYEDGSEITEYSDGIIEKVGTDRTKHITYEGGKTEFVQTNGVRTVTETNGDIQTIYPIEDKTETDKYNGKTYYYEDGTSQYIKAEDEKPGSVGMTVNSSDSNENEEGQEQEISVPVIRPGDSLGIECLMPGEVILGTYVDTPTVLGEHNPDEAYFRLSKAFVTTMEGSNTEIPVTIQSIPSHMNRILVVDNRSIIADPVDTNSGAHLIEHGALSVNGVSTLSLDLNYNSRLIVEAEKLQSLNNGEGVDAVRQIGKNTMGNGWSHNYETWLTENKDGSITVYWSPYSFSVFYSGNGDDRTIYGTYDKYGNIILTKDVPKGEAEFRSKSKGMKDNLLKRNADGTYVITFANGNKYYYNTQGQLVRMVDRTGQDITITRTELNKLVIAEPSSNQSLTLTYNDRGLVESVEDKTGRKTSFQYDEYNNLITLTDPNGKTASYTYDSKGLALSGKDGDNVTYFKNTYDEEGRVLTQDDAVDGNDLTTFSYDETSEFWRTITTIKDRNGNTTKRIHNRDGQLVRAEDELGNITYYTYDGNGNRTSMTDPKGYTIIYTYDEKNNLLSIEDAESAQTVYTYDGNGNILTATDDAGNKVVNTYTANNLLETSTDQKGIKTTYTYNEQGQILTKTVQGLGTQSYTYENGLMRTATDYLGNSYIYEYDRVGRVTAVIDREGSRSTITYDNVGNVLSRTDPLGNTATFTYDSRGNILSETNSKGNTAIFKYNGNGKLVEAVDHKGNKTTYEYDGEDRLIKVTDPQGYTAETTYDSAGRAIAATDALGNVSTFTYDSNGLLLSQKLPGGGYVTYTYYKNGKIKTKTDELGNTTTYNYDLLWRVRSITNATGKSVSYTYDEFGDVLSVTDPLGDTVRYTYDTSGNILTTTDAKGNVTTFTYNANGMLTSVTDALNNKTQYEYDKEDRLIKIINAKGFAKELTYDANGRVVQAKDELGNIVTTEYDEVGNLVAVKDAYGVTITNIEYDNMNDPISITDTLGNQAKSTYDSLGRLVETLDKLNRITKYEYDAMYRLTKVIDPLNGVSSQTYDADGNLKSYTDPNGNTTSYNYDLAGRLVSETTAIGSVKTYGYNALNLLERSTNGRNQETTYIYDDAAQLISFTDVAGTVAYTYDANGNILTVTDEKGTITREYDALDRITKYTDYNGNSVSYSYDCLGNLIALTYPGGRIVRYDYDAANNLIAVTDWANRVTNYEYDKNGRLTKTVRPNGTVLTITYNAAGQILQRKDVDASGNIINQYDYEYDATGNVTVEQSSYEVQAYDMTNVVMTYDSGNRLLTYNGQTVEYDADGNMTYGPLNSEMVNFTYDCRNRLIQAGNTTYEYDAENIRIAVVENGIRTEYVNNPNAFLSQLLIKRNADGSETFYTYGIGLIGHEDSKGNYRTYHYDMRGSTTAITDETGIITDRFEYAPYGELVNHIGDTITPFLYNGRDGVMTDANGLYYMRARYYNPDIKRFINQDILTGSITDGRTLNRYAYVNGNPISLIDPFGLSASLSEIGHDTLDVLGFLDIPIGPTPITIGMVADGINAVWYITEGKYFDAALSAISILPLTGSLAAKVIRWGSNGFKTVKVGSKIIKGTAKLYEYSRPVTRTISRMISKARTNPIGRVLTSNVARDAVISGAFSAGIQSFRTGEIDWKQVGMSSLMGVGTGVISRKFARGNSRDVGGARQSALRNLNADEIATINKEFAEIGGDPSILRFNSGRRTGYVDEADIIRVRGDILPVADSIHPRSAMSSKAALAHELGHRAHRGTKLAPSAWNDEFRASYWAAKNVPGLSEMDRIHLIEDAIMRAQEAGVSIKNNRFMRNILYGY